MVLAVALLAALATTNGIHGRVVSVDSLLSAAS
jgi:hypothetical protein